jgi:hypothetical protein
VWLRPFVDETTLEGTQFSKFGDESLESVMNSSTTLGKKESSHGFTAKLVCTECNNTWMSKLENEVKSILIKDNKLLDSIPNNISKNDSDILSCWLIVKALLFSNKIFSNIHMFKKSVFENIKNRNIDSGFLIEMTSAFKPKFDFFVGKGLLHDNLIRLKKIQMEHGKEMVANFFTCSIQLNHLLFRISYLEPDVPFKREVTLKKTMTLFPFGNQTINNENKEEDKIWEKVVSDDLELYLFGMGLMLVEKD